jgi:hypothetical protein
MSDWNPEGVARDDRQARRERQNTHFHRSCSVRGNAVVRAAITRHFHTLNERGQP